MIKVIIPFLQESTEASLKKPALLALEDGSLFWGESIGVTGQSPGEVVFNTSMTGYQEILTDPSYAKQIVTLTYPHIGNVGVNEEDDESRNVWVSGLVIRDLPLLASNWRSQSALDDYLRLHNVVGIASIDTRRLTRILRDKGAQNGCIMSGQGIDEESALQMARSFPGLKGMDLAKEVTTREQYKWQDGIWQLESGYNQNLADQNQPYHIVAYDFGVKHNMLRLLAERGCRITVIPAQTPAKEVLNMKPDGVFLTNGPGDPEPCDYAIAAIREIMDTGIPTFGICLGHQLLALASGAKTVKMKFGHHGANHPVQDLNTGQVLITSQNHGFAVDEKTLPQNVVATHQSLFDRSLQGIQRTDKPAFSFQGHPEASPGPHDIRPLFDKFIDMINDHK
jgi:carbamoyl-phosphate synthase small subunit